MKRNVAIGVMLTIGSYLSFSIADATTKLLVTKFPIFQVLFVRSVTILCLAILIGGLALTREIVRSPSLKPLFFRNLLLVASSFAYCTASRSLGLAELTTFYYAAPIMVTLLAVPILKEVVPKLRWTAVGLGFLGVMVACGPMGGSLSTAFELCAVATFAAKPQPIAIVTTIQRHLINHILVSSSNHHQTS